MSNKVSAAPESQYKIVDLSDNDTTVYSGAAQLLGIHVRDAMSAHACPLKDGGTSGANPFTVPASTSVGTWIEGGNMRFATDLVVDPDDAATGFITVVYIPDNEGQVGSGAGLP
jgi:hypothetical protein